MNVNMQSTKNAKWTTRMWRTLAALDEAICVSPMGTWKGASQRWNRKFGPEVSRRALARKRSLAKALNSHRHDSWRVERDRAQLRCAAAIATGLGSI